jgi:hypothetical protein
LSTNAQSKFSLFPNSGADPSHVRRVPGILGPFVGIIPSAGLGLTREAPATSRAVANAVYQAPGRRIRDLPITIDKLIMA